MKPPIKQQRAGELMSVDIEQEMWAAYSCLGGRQREWLLSEIGTGCFLKFGPFGVRNGAITMPLRVRDRVIDLVHWPVREPDQFSTLRGSDLLGAEALTEALDFDFPLRIFQTPWGMLRATSRDWLITERRAPPGCVVLNPKAWHGIFAELLELVCESRAHAEEIDRAIRQSGKQSPTIVWLEPERSSA